VEGFTGMGAEILDRLVLGDHCLAREALIAEEGNVGAPGTRDKLMFLLLLLVENETR
jgi:hypothetical protein